MIYLLCVICPPAGVLLRGKPMQSLLNLLLTFLGWVPGVIHAILVVNKANADKRHKESMKQLKKLSKNETKE